MAGPGLFGVAVLMMSACILLLYYFRHYLRDAWYLITCRAHRLERTQTGTEWWVMVLTAPIVTIIVGHIIFVVLHAFFRPPQAILIPSVLNKSHSLMTFIMNIFIAALLEEAIFRLLPLGVFVFLPLCICRKIGRQGSFALNLSFADRIWCGFFILVFLYGWCIGDFGFAFAMVFLTLASRVFMKECLQWNARPRFMGIPPRGLLLFYIVAFSAIIIFALGHIFNYLPQPPLNDAVAVQAWLVHGLSRFDLYPYVLPQFFSGVMFTVVYLRSPGRWMLPLAASTITHFMHNIVILVVLPLLAGMR